MSRRIAEMLVRQKASVISGLALGCDTAAHLRTLNSGDSGGKTVAVLAHGLDRIYPSENMGLAKRIVEEGECLLSEYAPGIGPQRHFFPARNRLQSGLSESVIVVECGEKSGTMHTAKFCLEQQKRLACLASPSHLGIKAGFSGNQLLEAQGAFSFRTIEELEQFLFQQPTLKKTTEQLHAFKTHSRRVQESIPDEKVPIIVKEPLNR